jgi:hypothetical protein
VNIKSVIPATISNYPGTLGLLEKVKLAMAMAMAEEFFCKNLVFFSFFEILNCIIVGIGI